MPFVLDASVALAWCLQDESSAYADGILDKLAADFALVPPIWPLEVGNALAVAERRGRLSGGALPRVVELLRSLPLRLADAALERSLGIVLSLARAQGLTTYDASYLELALREGLPLASGDARLRRGASAAGVSLVP